MKDSVSVIPETLFTFLAQGGARYAMARECNKMDDKLRFVVP